MQSRWPFFFAALLLFVITIMSLHVWAQEQSKAREALLAAAAKTNKQTVESRRSVEPRPVGSRVVSGVTANEVKTTPYTRNGRNPFKLPKAKVNVLGKAPVADPVSAPIESREFESRNFKSRDFESGRYEPTETVNPFAAQKHAPEFSLAPLNAIPSETSAAETAPSFGNPWQHDSDPDLGEEPNSPRNNLEKLAELLPPTEQPLPLSDSQSFSPALTPQDGASPAADDDLLALNPSDDEPEPESVPERDSVFKFASSKKAVASPLPGSAVKKRRRPPAQPIIEIEIPEWDPDAAWPKPTAIIEQLEEFRKHPATEHWAAETHQLLKLLHWTKSIDDPNARVIFEQLRTKLQELDNICIQISDTPVHSAEYAQGYLAGQLRIFHYDIARRIVFWSQIHDIAVRNNSEVLNPQGEKLGMVQASQFRFVPPNLGSEWSGYLGLDELTQSLNSLNPDPKSQRDAARHTLTRFFSSAIKNEHRQFLDPYFDDQLLSYLRDEAAAPVDLQKMLKMIEYHEANLSGYSVAKMNDIYQSLLWSTDPASQQLATQMDGHYRNANFRVSISDEFLNRLVPQQPETNQPIHETVMGAKVRGNGRINNRLRIRLMPDNGQVNLRLEANGVVRSLTQARRNGFTVDNQGQTRYQAFQNLAIGRYGYHAGAAQAHSQTNSRVLRLRSELDPIPLVGWMARRIAKDKIAESTPATERMTDRRIESSAKQEIETQVHQRMAAVRHYLSANLTDPLIAMEMEPTPLELRTTSDRVIMRYRLAGRDQMAAHTARPRALANSLMSLQFHESMINNLLERIELKGNEFTAEELVQHLRNVFRSDKVVASKEIETEATFEFAPYDPLRIQFVDNKVELGLNLKKFRIGKGKTWKNLKVTATYLPSATGMRLALIQDDSGISLKGSNLKLRDQIAVRTVFTALFEDRYEMNILPEKFSEKFQATNLRISHLAITDGWIGISLGEQAHFVEPYRAAEQTGPASRVPVYNFRR